jgi:O-antigen ligase
VIAATIILANLAQYLWVNVWPSIPLIKAQSPGIYVLLFGMAAAVCLWILAPLNSTRSGPLAVFVGALLVTWLLIMAVSIIHVDRLDHSVWTYAPILIMLWFKMPSASDLTAVLVLAAWLLTGILIATRLLEMVGAIPMLYVAPELIAYEKSQYWLPLSGWLGPEGRWPGPMGHNAMTGNIGAYLLVIGVALRSRSGAVFAAVGVLTLLLTSSRGSLVAAAIGVAVVVLLGSYRWNRRMDRRWLIAGALGVGVIALTTSVIASPNLTGRGTYWAGFIELWQTSPWIGVGLTGKAAGDPAIAGTNAHNLVLDTLAKYGVISAIPLVVALAASAYLGIRAVARKFILPLGVIVTFLVIGLTESDIGWIGPSTPWLLLVLATFLAAAWPAPESEGSGP